MKAFEDYIAAAPSAVQLRLLDILTFIGEKFPDAEQRIYHGIPAFFKGKRDIICIGAYRDHFGIYVGCSLTEYLKRKYPECRYTKSAVQFPYTQPLPADILTDICAQIK